jgi:hypothetical protein
MDRFIVDGGGAFAAPVAWIFEQQTGADERMNHGLGVGSAGRTLFWDLWFIIERS